MKYIAQIDEQSYEIEPLDENRLRVNGEEIRIDVRPGSRPEHLSLITNGRSHQVWLEAANGATRVHVGGYDFNVRVEDERLHRLRQLAAHEVSSHHVGEIGAPMPGLVVKLLVQPGQTIKKGKGVVIVEAMKMENEIRSPISGIVSDIRVKERQAVEKGEILAVIA